MCSKLFFFLLLLSLSLSFFSFDLTCLSSAPPTPPPTPSRRPSAFPSARRPKLKSNNRAAAAAEAESNFRGKSKLGIVFPPLAPHYRAARLHSFIPKIPIWVNFGGSCNGRCWYSLLPFGLFYSHLVYFVTISYNSWSFGTFFPVLVCCAKKNLATLPHYEFL
jgi:hypothetical protein